METASRLQPPVLESKYPAFARAGKKDGFHEFLSAVVRPSSVPPHRTPFHPFFAFLFLDAAQEIRPPCLAAYRTLIQPRQG
jgi:hypothetical protein